MLTSRTFSRRRQTWSRSLTCQTWITVKLNWLLSKWLVFPYLWAAVVNTYKSYVLCPIAELAAWYIYSFHYHNILLHQKLSWLHELLSNQGWDFKVKKEVKETPSYQENVVSWSKYEILYFNLLPEIFTAKFVHTCIYFLAYKLKILNELLECYIVLYSRWFLGLKVNALLEVSFIPHVSYSRYTQVETSKCAHVKARINNIQFIYRSNCKMSNYGQFFVLFLVRLLMTVWSQQCFPVLYLRFVVKWIHEFICK